MLHIKIVLTNEREQLVCVLSGHFACDWIVVKNGVNDGCFPPLLVNDYVLPCRCCVLKERIDGRSFRVCTEVRFGRLNNVR